MKRSFVTLAVLASGLVLLSFTVVVVNQTAQVVELADHMYPGAGRPTLITLLAMYAGLIGTPIVLLCRLPRSLNPPESTEDPRFEGHVEQLRARLVANPRVVDKPTGPGLEPVERALGDLDRQADEIVRDAAKLIFLSTAVSQFGKLDALIVMAAQSRMVWRLAHLYNQRPTPRDMVRLYANVAGTAFAAGALDEADLETVVQPIVSSTVGSMAGAIPGFQAATTVLVGSVMTGTANAYLTLRVGLIARRYCGAVIVRPKAELRRSASLEAGRMLGEIVSVGTKQLAGAMFGAVKTWGTQTVGAAVVKGRTAFSTAGDRAATTRDAISSMFRRGKGEPEPAS